MVFIFPRAGRPRYCTAAAFASLKKYAAHFFNFAFGVTEPKEAAYAVAGVNSEKCLLNHLSFEISSCFGNYSQPKFFNDGLRKIALRNLRNEA